MSATLLRTMVLGLAVLSAGCASTYTQDRANGMLSSQVGTLDLANPAHSGILVEWVDGDWTGARPRAHFVLTPGEHALKLKANVPFYSSGEQLVYFDVAPGGHYRLASSVEPDAGTWGYAIVDAATGVRVDRVYSNRSGAGGQ